MSQLQQYYNLIGKVGRGAQAAPQTDGFLSERVSQFMPSHGELARSGRLFTGGILNVAHAVVPVVDLPTTTAPVLIYNAALAAGSTRSLYLLHVGVTIGSGTVGAAGFSVFAGVTNGAVATPLTANGTGLGVQSTNGNATSIAFCDVAKTIITGTSWLILDGLMTTAVAVTGCGKGIPLNGSLIARPGYGIVLGVMGDLGTSAKYVITALWSEIESDFEPL